ncbi:hypothetical protein FRC00_011718, partial [Tulasnella sp. 408]
TSTWPSKALMEQRPSPSLVRCNGKLGGKEKLETTNGSPILFQHALRGKPFDGMSTWMRILKTTGNSSERRSFSSILPVPNLQLRLYNQRFRHRQPPPRLQAPSIRPIAFGCIFPTRKAIFFSLPTQVTRGST